MQMEEDTFRHLSFADEESEVEGVDYAPSIDLEEDEPRPIPTPTLEVDQSARLAAKIREQAARLHTLEADNKHWKQRYEEASKSQNAFNASPAVQETQVSGENFTQIRALHRENEDLQKSLSAEILNNESQRAYVDILRQALEAKMDDIGIQHKNVDAFAQLTQVKEESDQARRDAANLSNVVKDQEFKISRVSEKLALASEDNEQAAIQQEELQINLNESIKALKIAQIEINKLTTENTQLLEHIEVQNMQAQESDTQMNESKSKIDTMNKTINTSSNEMNNLKEKVKQLEKDIAEKDAEIEAEKQTLYEIHANFTKAESALKKTQYDHDAAKLIWEKEKRLLQNEIATLKDSHEEVSQQYSKTRVDLHTAQTVGEDAAHRAKGAQSDLHSVKLKNESLSANLQAVQETLRETQNEKDKLIVKHEKTLNELTNLQYLSESLRLKVHENENLSLEFSQQIADLNFKMSTKKDRIRSLKQEQDSLTRCMDLSALDKSSIQDTLQKTQNDLFLEQDNINKLEKKIRMLSHENEQVFEKNRTLEDLNLDKNQEVQSLQEENDKIRFRYQDAQRRMEETEMQLNRTVSDYEEAQALLKLHETDLHSTQTEIKHLETKVASQRYSGGLIDEENKQLKFKLEEQGKKLDSIVEKYEKSEKRLQDALQEYQKYRVQAEELNADLQSQEAKARRMAEEITKVEEVAHQERSDKSDAIMELQGLEMAIKKINHILSTFANNMLVILSTSHQYSSVVGNGVQEILPRLASGRIDLKDVSHLVDWVGVSCDELESLIRRAQSLKAECEKQALSITELQDTRFRDNEERDRLHTQHMEATARDHNTAIKEISQYKARELELSKNVEALEARMQQMSDQASEELQLRMIENRDIKNAEALIERLRLLLPGDQQRAAGEIVRTRREMSDREREKSRLEIKLRYLEENGAATNRRELDITRDALSTCKRDIAMHQRTITQHEEMLYCTAPVSGARAASSGPRRQSSVASLFSKGDEYEDRLKDASIELERTRYEKMEMENAYNDLLNEKYKMAAQQLSISAYSAKSPLKPRVPSLPRTAIGSGLKSNKSSLGKSIEARLSQSRLQEDILRSSEKDRFREYSKAEDI